MTNFVHLFPSFEIFDILVCLSKNMEREPSKDRNWFEYQQNTQCCGKRYASYEPTHNIQYTISPYILEYLLTLLHCLHFPFWDLLCTQWWCIQVCSLYCRTPTSLKDGLHENLTLSIRMEMQDACATILHAGQRMRGPCFWNTNKEIIILFLWYKDIIVKVEDKLLTVKN